MSPRFSLVISLILSAVLFSAAVAQDNSPETFSVDDDSIQEYKGKLGRWVYVPNKAKLAAYTKDFASNDSDVSGLNPGAQKYLNRYCFIPFGKDYIDKLAEKGVDRSVLSASPDQFIWPVGEVIRISSVLGFRGRGEFHTGVDIPAPRGAIIRAAMEGQVLFEGYSGGYGNMVDIQHRNGFITRYGHNTVVLVKKGDFVKKGQAIALAGSTGRSTGPHCHFEILCNTIPLDPLDFLPDASKVQVVHQLKNWKTPNRRQ
jgi:murein DD-endopeptidase MepM/ murein hydrolase activator NlpD